MGRFQILIFLVLCYNVGISQHSSLQELHIKYVDSISKQQLKFQKENIPRETLVFLVDSLFRYNYDDVVGPCEYQPIKNYYTYNEFGNITTFISKNTPEEGCTNGYINKSIFNYDGEILVNSLDQYYDFMTNEWVNQSRRTYQYDEANNLIELLIQIRNNESDGWNNLIKTTYAYVNNLQTEVNTYNWDVAINDWFWDKSIVSVYNNNDDLVEYIINYWDEDSNDWETRRKQTYSYDNNFNVIEYVLYIKSPSEEIYEWSSISKNTYLYDVNNFLNEYITYDGWNNLTNEWDYIKKEIYEIDGNGIVQEEIRLFWDATLLDWINSRKRFFTYDSNLNLIYTLRQNWNLNLLDWENSLQTTSIYNEFNKKTYSLLESWISGSNIWVFESQRNFEYDEFQNLIFSSGNSNFDSFDYYYFYSQYNILETPENSFDNVFSIVPNPNRGVFTINGLDANSQLFVYDSSGKLIKQIVNSQSIDISSFQKGIYLLRIISEDAVVTKKLIKI